MPHSSPSDASHLAGYPAANVMENKLKFHDCSGEDVDVSLHVATYYQSNRLYVGIGQITEVGPVFYCDLTINLDFEPATVNEAYIPCDNAKEILAFIQENNLGVVLPTYGHSGFAAYPKVAFNLEKLAEYDHAGVEQYLQYAATANTGEDDSEWICLDDVFQSLMSTMNSDAEEGD